MSHNIRQNDSMISVGQRPWHGLGVTLDTSPATGLQALQMADMDWTVTRRGLILEDGRPAAVSGAVSRKNDGQHAAIVREDTNEILGIVGPSYKEYQNRKMASLFDPLIDDGKINIETCGSLFNGRRVWMLAKFVGDNMTIEQGDEVAKYLLLAHGHDGCFAVRFGFTPIRVVCWNTLSAATAPDSKSRLIRCLHTENLESNLKMIRNAMVAAEETFEFTADQYRLLASRGVSRADLREYARLIMDANSDDTKWTAGQRDKIGKIIGAACEGRGNSGRNFWHAYNGVTEYLAWEKGRRVDNRTDSLWFGDSARISEQALELALTMSA